MRKRMFKDKKNGYIKVYAVEVHKKALNFVGKHYRVDHKFGNALFC